MSPTQMLLKQSKLISEGEKKHPWLALFIDLQKLHQPVTKTLKISIISRFRFIYLFIYIYKQHTIYLRMILSEKQHGDVQLHLPLGFPSEVNCYFLLARGEV